jgi:adenylylsulfate kinase-like enzyme
LPVCVSRDPKGLYKRAMSGQIKNFTGLDSPYEMPENPELTLITEAASPENLASRVVDYLKTHALVP